MNFSVGERSRLSCECVGSLSRGCCCASKSSPRMDGRFCGHLAGEFLVLMSTLLLSLPHSETMLGWAIKNWRFHLFWSKNYCPLDTFLTCFGSLWPPLFSAHSFTIRLRTIFFAASPRHQTPINHTFSLRILFILNPSTIKIFTLLRASAESFWCVDWVVVGEENRFMNEVDISLSVVIYFTSAFFLFFFCCGENPIKLSRPIVWRVSAVLCGSTMWTYFDEP